jgi:bidirectional [NiFe] hydrogenase diaphorase subunit
MQKHNYSSRALIETLHVIQDSFGFIDEQAMQYVAQELKVPLSKVFSVATFYNGFTSKPPANIPWCCAPVRPATSRATTGWWNS